MINEALAPWEYRPPVDALIGLAAGVIGTANRPDYYAPGLGVTDAPSCCASRSTRDCTLETRLFR